MTSPRGLGGVFSLPVTGCSCLLSLAATFCSLIPPRPCPIPGAPALQDSQPPILVLCPAGSQWAEKAVPFHSQLWFGHLKQPFVATLPRCWLDVSRGLIAAAECCHSHGRASNPHALGMSELPPYARQTSLPTDGGVTENNNGNLVASSPGKGSTDNRATYKKG